MDEAAAVRHFVASEVEHRLILWRDVDCLVRACHIGAAKARIACGVRSGGDNEFEAGTGDDLLHRVAAESRVSRCC